MIMLIKGQGFRFQQFKSLEVYVYSLLNSNCSPSVSSTMLNETHPPRSRQIDKLPITLKRSKEMQVLCVGLSRTATLCKMPSWFGPSIIHLDISSDVRCFKETRLHSLSRGGTFDQSEKYAYQMLARRIGGKTLHGKVFRTNRI